MKIAVLRKFQACLLLKDQQILRSNADFETVHAFSHSLDPLQPVAEGMDHLFRNGHIVVNLSWQTWVEGMPTVGAALSRRLNRKLCTLGDFHAPPSSPIACSRSRPGMACVES